jgi:hypothetical protein
MIVLKDCTIAADENGGVVITQNGPIVIEDCTVIGGADPPLIRIETSK